MNKPRTFHYVEGSERSLPRRTRNLDRCSAMKAVVDLMLARRSTDTGSLTSVEISKQLGWPDSYAHDVLLRLQNRGLVRRVSRGSVKNDPSRWELNEVAP